MLAWVAATGVRAICDAGDVTIGTTDWSDRQGGPEHPHPVDERVTGTVGELSIPSASATLSDAAGRRRVPVDSTVELPPLKFVLDCRPAAGHSPAGGSTVDSEALEVSIHFAGPATIGPDGDRLRLTFPEPSPVSLGFAEHADDPATITVPPTPEGVATALTHLPAALRTTGPERSHPSHRDHPPVVDVGDEVAVPRAVRESTPETGIELQVPPELAYLFVGAPLAYYLAADVTVTEDAGPRLVAPAADVDCRFRRLPTFQHGVARLLRQVFFFDSLVRDVEGDPAGQQAALCEHFGLDAAHVRSLSPAERLARYFWVSECDLSGLLPEWHLSTSAAPERENLRCLPYLLDALSLVYLPESSELRKPDLLERALDDCYCLRSSAQGQSVQSVDLVNPAETAGRVHAWLAPGAPIDAFKTTPTAYENRRAYQGEATTPLSVTVVLNDEAMSDEHAAVADIYRERSADLPLSVTVREHLSRAALADVFATQTDFVHYIGHCDDGGLECPDGRFDAGSLERSRARTFFLNACGSYHQGLALVERGSVAGAVTLTKVLDRQAAKVGTAFARLLVHGFGLEPAIQLSRRRIMMGKDYAVVGDGTYTLAPSPDPPIVGRLEARGERFRLRCEAASARRTGDGFTVPFADEPALPGTTAEATLDRDALSSALAETGFPVIFDGEFHWSTALAEQLTGVDD